IRPGNAHAEEAGVYTIDPRAPACAVLIRMTTRLMMIYRTEGERGKVYEPLDWKLYSADHRRIPLKSEEELREYLKSQPDEDFYLVPGPYMSREIQGADAVRFDPRGEHIRCGIVRYDSASAKIATRNAMKVTYSDEA